MGPRVAASTAVGGRDVRSAGRANQRKRVEKMAHPNAELIRGGYEAFARGDVDTVMGLLADDIVWHVPGHSPIAGDYHGHDGVMGFFGTLQEETGGTFRLEIHDVAATDEHVLAIIDFHAERHGHSRDANAIHVWHVRDGKAVEFRAVLIDPYADDEFWAS
jgi:ketosteroid isomerase-like protein